jgi:hypothetical protein
MSIVNDALKKIEEKRNGEDGTNLSGASVHFDVKAEHKKAVHHFATKMIIVWCCGVVLLGVFIFLLIHPKKKAYVLYSPKGDVQKVADPSAVVQQDEAAQNVVSAPILPNMAVAPSVNKSGFRLSGIMFSEAEPMAIINNEIVKPGDTINNAKVELIEETQVTLSSNGQEFTLSVK